MVSIGLDEPLEETKFGMVNPYRTDLTHFLAKEEASKQKETENTEKFGVIETSATFSKKQKNTVNVDDNLDESTNENETTSKLIDVRSESES